MNNNGLLSPRINGSSFVNPVNWFRWPFSSSKPPTPQLPAKLAEAATVVADGINPVSVQAAREASKRQEVHEAAIARAAGFPQLADLSELGPKEADLKQEIDKLEMEKATAKKWRDEEPRKVRVKDDITPPSTFDWVVKFGGSNALVLALAVWGWLNTSRFLLPQMQSWEGALLTTATLLVVPLFLKLAVTFCFDDPAVYQRVLKLIVFLSVAALLVWMVALLKVYFVPITLDELKARGSSRDSWKEALFLTQMLYELGFGCLLMHNVWEVLKKRAVSNPVWEKWNESVTGLDKQLKPLLREYRLVVQNIQVLAAIQHRFVNACYDLYLENCKDHEQAESERNSRAASRATRRAAILQPLK